MPAEQKPTPRERRRERTKALILEAAEMLLAEGGLQNATLIHISRRAGYSKPALYEYFSGIEDILIELSNQGFMRLGERIRSVDSALAPDERLLAASRVFLQFAAENAELYQLMFSHIIFSDNTLDRDWQEVRQKTRVAYYAAHEIIQDGIQQGIYKTRSGFDGGAMLYLCWVTLHGIASLKRELAMSMDLDVERYQAAILQLMLANLRGSLPEGS